MSRVRFFSCLRRLMGRRLWWATLLALLGMAVMTRLGIWQLDRLDQRKALNAQTQVELEAPPLDLNEAELALISPDDAGYRQVIVSGTYDIEHQVVLVQQRYAGRLGSHLVTPLRLAGSDLAVLVDRGWVAATDDGSPGWPDYPEPGQIVVQGYLRRTEARQTTSPVVGSVEEPVDEWFRVDVAAIGAQLPYPIADYYVLALPENGQTGMAAAPPYREAQSVDLSNGPHLGYAIQWFAFTLILGGGYVYLACRSPRQQEQPSGTKMPATTDRTPS